MNSGLRRMRIGFPTAVAMTALLAGCATTTEKPAAEILDSGICNVSYPEDGMENQGVKVRFISTHSIPLHKGLMFGFSWRTTGLPLHTPLEFVVESPDRNQAGKSMKRTVPARVGDFSNDQSSIYCAELNESEDLVPGEWKIHIQHDGRILKTQTYRLIEENQNH